MTCTMTVDGPCHRTLAFSIERQRLTDETEARIQTIASQTNFKGFRAGKAPIAMVRKTHGANALEEARRTIIGEAYRDAVAEHELRPVGDPEMNLESLNDDGEGPFTFEFGLEVAPEVELSVGDNIPVEVVLPKITDEMVETEVERIREQGAKLEDAAEGEGAGEEDILEGTSVFNVDGVELEPRTERAVFLKHELVDAIPVKGSREVFLDAKVGDSISIELELPAHFDPEEHAGKKATLQFSVERVRKVQLAVLDEEFLKRVGVATEEELRLRIHEAISEQRNQSGTKQLDHELEKYLLENHDVQVPERLLAKNIDHRVHEHAHKLMKEGGMSSEDGHAAAEEQREGIAEASERGLKLAFIFAAIVKAEEIQPTVEDAVAQVRSVSSAQGSDPEEAVKAAFSEGWIGDVQEQLANERAREWLRKRAKITETEPKPSDNEPS